MSGTPAVAALETAWARVLENAPSETVLPLIDGIGPGDPGFRQAQHIRGLCALQDGDATRAQALFFDAIRQGEATAKVWINLARAAAANGLPDEPLDALAALLGRADPPQLFTFSQTLLRALGFTSRDSFPRKDAVFLKIVLPLLSILLERRQMDEALHLEGLVYEAYVKPRETEAHFEWSMQRVGALFTRAAHQWCAELPPLPQPPMTPPYRISFFLHNASTLAHIEVLLNTLKGYRTLADQPFEPAVYCFGGKSAPMEAALAALGVQLVMLNERFPETARSPWRRLLRLRELLAAEGVQELVWVSLVTLMPLAFGIRMAPVQTWWAMKYRSFSCDDIDGYVTGSALTRYATVHGRRWRMGRLGVDDWYDPEQEARAAEIRATLGGRLVLMTLARDEKMRDPAYLAAVSQILQAHPHAVFLWAGREARAEVTAAFRAAGVLDRTHFIGWVNTRLYAQVADVFLDSFPFPCGFTLFQAMAAGKPVVIYDSPESMQVGLWSFLQPLVDGTDGTAEERAELAAIIGDAANPLVAVARSPDDYVRLAGRFIDDADARAAGGEASRRFIARYFSDPQAMASSFTSHFVELIEARRA